MKDYYETIARMLKWRNGFLWGEEAAVYNGYVIYRKPNPWKKEQYHYSLYAFDRDIILGHYTLPEVLKYLDERIEVDFGIHWEKTSLTPVNNN